MSPAVFVAPARGSRASFPRAHAVPIRIWRRAARQPGRTRCRGVHIAPYHARGRPFPAGRGGRVQAAPKPATATATPPAMEHAPLPYQGPIILNGQLAHSLTRERLEVVRSLDDWAESDLIKLLKPVDKCWQPTEFLPDSADPDFEDKVGSRVCRAGAVDAGRGLRIRGVVVGVRLTDAVARAAGAGAAQAGRQRA